MTGLHAYQDKGFRVLFNYSDIVLNQSYAISPLHISWSAYKTTYVVDIIDITHR